MPKQNFESLSDNNLISLFDVVKCYISTDKTLQKISLVVEIVEIRNYNGMAFLKVKDDTATISSVIYKSIFKDNIEPGNKIKINGCLDLYRGQIQLIIKSYQKIGSVDNSQFMLLKNKLAKLGYFDQKPILENNYTNIGIISSLNAAGLCDFLHTMNQRCFNKKLYIYPSSVQGKNAPNEISLAIQLANKHNIAEILVLIRGGGSKEDLECFNSETVAVAIHKSKIPIVTGIGHQIDVSIADLVCTKSFITPTAVAQNITMENINSKNTINKLVSDIGQKIVNYIDKLYEYITNQECKLAKYQNNLVTSINDNLANYIVHANNMKKKIIISADSKYDYIINSEKLLSEIFSMYYTNLKNKSQFYENNLLINIDKCGQIIEVYDKKIKLISQPRIVDASGKEITLLEDFTKNKKYKICFIDGTFNLNLK